MLPFIIGAGIVAVSAAAASKPKKKKSATYPNQISRKGERRLPSAHTLPQPVSLILAQKAMEQEKAIQELCLLYTALVKKVDKLEEENSYKVTVH